MPSQSANATNAVEHYRVVIADDHPLFREALVGRVQRAIPGVTIIEVADMAGVQEVLSDAGDIDLLLLDLNMPGAQGLSALVHVRAIAPDVPVVVVSAMEEAAVVQRAVGLGAAGFIPKSSGLEQISAALRAVLAGQISVPARFQGLLLEVSAAEANAAQRIGTLTAQQFRIAVLLAGGMLNKQIGWHLEITEATVKVHMSTILRKLGAQNRTQVALRMQVFDFDGSTGEAGIPDSVRRR